MLPGLGQSSAGRLRDLGQPRPTHAAILDAAEELRIEAVDWRSGDEPWIVDAVILPGSETALAAMFATLFPDGVRQFAQGVNARIDVAEGPPEAAE